jgi:hypothetical protein
MQLTTEGGKLELFLPRNLGYGDHDAGSFIPEGIVCVFCCELHNDDVLTEFKKPLPKKKNWNVQQLIEA